MTADLHAAQGATRAPSLAAGAGELVNSLAELADVADGFCVMLRGKLPDSCGPEWRALVRLASSIAADVLAIHEGLDALSMALPDPAPGTATLRMVDGGTA